MRERLYNEIKARIPKHSVGRYDLLPLFAEPALARDIVSFLAEPYRGQVNFVAAPEAIGWILGALVAAELGVGFLPIRKSGKLPYPPEMLLESAFVDYSKSEKHFEVEKSAIPPDSRVLIADEWIETGAQINGLIGLLEQNGSEAAGIVTIGIDVNDKTSAWIDGGFVNYIGKDF